MFLYQLCYKFVTMVGIAGLLNSKFNIMKFSWRKINMAGI